MTVTVNPQGWSEFTPSGDGREIHVAAHGSDMNAGSSPSSPMRTMAEAVKNIRDGHGDWICPKSGDHFNEPPPKWIWSGESAQNPCGIRAYGGLERAHFQTSPGVTALHFEGGGGAPPSIQHVAFVGLDFHSVGRDGTDEASGVSILRPVKNLLFEDCRWSNYGNGVILNGFDGPLTNIRLRRCVIVDSWGTFGHVQGLYASNTSGLSLYECVLDHNGWNPDIYRHSIYHQNGNGPLTVEGCVISESASHGLQLRSGGRVNGNLFLRNPIAMSLGGGDYPAPDGVGVTVRGNVILEGRDIDASNPRGWAIHVSNIKKGVIYGNFIAHNQGGQPSGLRLEGEVAGGIHDLLVEENVIHDWGAGLEPSGDLSGVTYKNNYWNDASRHYFNSGRGVPSYMASIGWNPSTNDYIAAVRDLSKAKWNQKLLPQRGLIRHMQQGFKVVA